MVSFNPALEGDTQSGVLHLLLCAEWTLILDCTLLLFADNMPCSEHVIESFEQALHQLIIANSVLRPLTFHLRPDLMSLDMRYSTPVLHMCFIQLYTVQAEQVAD